MLFEQKSRTILSLSLTALLLSFFIYFERKEIEGMERFQNPFQRIQHPHSLEVFLMNFFYHHVKRSIQFSKKKIQPYLNDHVYKRDQSFDLFYIPKRKHHCQANFLYSMLNYEDLFLSSKYIYMDYSNKHALKKSLIVHWDFLNTGIYKYKEYNKPLIKKL